MICPGNNYYLCAMRVTIEEISDESRFEEILKLPYSSIASFVLSRMRNKSLPMLIFWVSCIITMSLSVIFFFTTLNETATIILWHILLGFVLLPIAIIPLHETLHIAPLLFAGMKNIRVGADISQFMFYVTTHKEVIARKQFCIVAMFPFITLTLGMVVLIFLLPGIWKFSMASLLFVHTTVCVGDFGLLDFYHEQGKREIYTWDDVDQKIAYFLVEKSGTMH